MKKILMPKALEEAFTALTSAILPEGMFFTRKKLPWYRQPMVGAIPWSALALMAPFAGFLVWKLVSLLLPNHTEEQQ